MHGAVVVEITLPAVVAAGIAFAVHHHEGSCLLAARVAVKRNRRAARLRPDLAADIVLTVGHQVVVPLAVVAAGRGIRAATTTSTVPATAPIPVVVPPTTVPVAAVADSATPEDVACVTYHATTIILDANDGDAVVGGGILEHVLAAASIDTLEAKIDGVAGHGLVALQANPLRRHSAFGLQEALVAADLHVGNTIDAHLKGALAAAVTAGDVGVDGLSPCGDCEE